MEYKVICITCCKMHRLASELERALNLLAVDGWHLTHLTLMPERSTFIATLERAKV